jgi:transcriptional regulator with XRE-family HTH domain
MLDIAEITDPTGGVYIPKPGYHAKDFFAYRMLEPGSYRLINDETGKDSRLSTQERLDYIQDIFPYRLLSETTGADIYECQDLLIILGTEVVSHNNITNALFFISGAAQVKRELPKPVSTLSSQGASFSRTKHEVADVANSLREFSGLDIESLARIFKVSRVTYHRWLRGLPVSKRHRDYILEILPLLEEAAQRLGSPEAVNTWLLSPLSSGGKKPIEYLAEKDLDLFRGFLLRQRTGKEQFHPLKPSRRVFKPRRREEVEDVREQLRPHTWYEQDSNINNGNE